MQENGLKFSFNTIVNIFALIVAVGLVSVFVYKNFLEKDPIEARLLHKGNTFIGLETINYSKSSNTILLALSTKCPYCTKNLPFYKDLIEKSKNSPNIRVIGLFAESQMEVDKFLGEHQVVIDTIPNADYFKLEIAQNPTIIWLNSDKTILNTWEGALKEKEEKEFSIYFEKTKNS